MKKISTLFLMLLFGAAAFGSPVTASKAKWLWSSDAKNAANTTCFYRYTLNIKSPVKSAEFTGYMDDAGRFFCNGKHILPHRIKEPRKIVKAFKYIITKELKTGKNVIALSVRNLNYTGGACMLGRIVYQNGKIEYIYTDKSWKATSKVFADCVKVNFDDSAWPSAVEFGDVQQLPWSKVSNIVDLCRTPSEKGQQEPCVDNDKLLSSQGYTPPSPAILPQVKTPKLELSRSKWLWCSDAPNGNATNCHYRYELNIANDVKSAEFVGYMDDVGKFFCNGKEIAEGRIKEVKKQVRAKKFVITQELKKGKNIIALKVYNDRYTGGACFLGKIVYKSGKIEYIHTSKSWKATTRAYKNFQSVDFDDSAWKPAVEFGDAGQKPWFIVSNITEVCTTPEEKEQLKKLEYEFFKHPESLKTEKQRTLKIVWKNDIPAFSDGQKEYPPSLFKFFMPSGLDYAKQADLLIKLDQAGYHVIETAISSKTIERSPGVYDFSILERDIGVIFKNVPDASIIVHIRIETLDEFLKKNPDEAIGYATGPADNSHKNLLWHSLDVGGRKIAPSYASLKFRKELRNFVLSFAEYAKKQPWRKRMVGVRISNGCYSEWHYFGMGGHMPDTGKAMTRAFREFARGKYKTVDALRKAWCDNNVTFDTITVPGVDERHGKKRFLRDSGSVDRKVMDYYICHQQAVADSLLAAAQAAKESMPDMLVGSFYGYVFGMAGFPSEGQTLYLEKVLSSPYIDFLSAPYSYSSYARYKGGDGLMRLIPETFKRYKKLALNEEDTRTYLMKKPRQYTNVNTADESVQIFLRDYAVHSMLGVGEQLNDFGASHPKMFFNDPQILTAIHHGNRNYLKVRDNIKPQTSKIGVIFNVRELYLHGHPTAATQQFNTMLSDHQIHALNKSGYSYDLMTLDDYLASNKKYETLVFLNAMTLSNEERAVIKQRTRNTSTIWIYAPGLVTENKWSEAAMKELTGIELKVKDAVLPMSLLVKDFGTIGNAKIAESPRIYVDDKAATALGHYSDQTVGMAQKGNVIFSAVPINKPEIWAALLKKSGAHAYVKPGIFVKAVDPYILLHVADAGSYTVSLSEKAARVVNVYENNKVVAQDTDRIVLKCNGCKTWFLKIE